MACAGMPSTPWLREARKGVDARPSPSMTLRREHGSDQSSPHRRQRRIRLSGVGSAGLRQIGPPAAALAAHRRRSRPHQIDGAEARREVRRDAHHDADLALGGGHQSDHAAAPICLPIASARPFRSRGGTSPRLRADKLHVRRSARPRLRRRPSPACAGLRRPGAPVAGGPPGATRCARAARRVKP